MTDKSICGLLLLLSLVIYGVTADDDILDEPINRYENRRPSSMKWRLRFNLHSRSWRKRDCTNDSSPGGCFDEKFSSKRSKRQPAARPIVGMSCQENIDCQTVDGGAVCSSQKRCGCLSAFVNINGYCWKKINPGQPGCQHNGQCDSVWPGALCTSAGVCTCPNNVPPHPTKDGVVCLLEGQCPTNGINSKLRDESGREVQCGGNDENCMKSLLYDCLCIPLPVDGTTVAGACRGVTYCCPSRGWTCTMPSEPGSFDSSTPPLTRWFYNSVNSRCESFFYHGTGGNANNFQTQSQCESYCITASTGVTCSRGNPNYVKDATGRMNHVRRTCSSSNRACGPGYSCTGDTLCCPSRGNICSLRGAVPGVQLAGPDPGQKAIGVRPSTRYFFDNTEGVCRPFTYNGVGGNFNNFHSEAHCQSYCSRTICAVGNPLADSAGVTLQCPPSGADTCPQKYNCEDSGYCCPSADFVCRQRLQIGSAVGGTSVDKSCTKPMNRWYYDVYTGDCSSFLYTGCQGNWNNFVSYDSCRSFCINVAPESSCPMGKAYKNPNGDDMICGNVDALIGLERNCPLNYYCYNDEGSHICCPTLTQTCTLEDADPGTPCLSAGRVNRWYYDARSRSCETFSYNGCDGNSNNFATKIDCEDYCGFTGCPDHGDVYSENGQYKPCTSIGSTSVDCPANYICSLITLPAGTRRGLFCCPTRTHICSQPRSSGNTCGGTASLTRYYFNKATKSCGSFQYNGCGGNDNNFDSPDSCVTFCQSAGCPFGQVALSGGGAGNVEISCDVNEIGSSTCSTNNGVCVRSPLLDSRLCCGSNAAASTCPSGHRAYVDSLSNKPLQCVVNLEGSCPAGYSCYYSPNFRNSFCCGMTLAQCPDGSELLTTSVTATGQPRPRQCTPELAGSCPYGYFCQSLTLTVGNVVSSSGHCCSLPNPCGPGYTAFRDDYEEAVACNRSSTCPMPYDCIQKTCCAALSSLINVCATGRRPLYSAGAPTMCDPASTLAVCPRGYTCDLYPSTNSYYCCTFQNQTISTAVQATTSATKTTTTSISGGCPTNSRPTSPITFCSPNTWSPPCPNNSFCTYDAGRNRFICCLMPIASSTPLSTTTRPTLPLASSVCPRGRTPALDSQSGRVLACSESFQCPTAYSCIYSPNGAYCCSVSADGGCPNSTKAYIYSWSNTPLSCLPNSGPKCPSGFDCVRSTITRTSFQCCSTVTSVAISNSTRADGCPSGTKVFLYSPTNTPLICTLNGPVCPVGYSCTGSTVSNDFRCCSTPSTTTAVSATSRRISNTTQESAKNNTGCPRGSEPYMYPGSVLPLSCQANGPPCPKNYRCVQSSEYNWTMICCRSSTVTTTTTRGSVYAADENEIEVEIELANGAFAGEPCVNDDECRHGAGSKASCRNGFCICASNEVNLLGICSRAGCPSPYKNVAGKCVPISRVQQHKNRKTKSWPRDKG